MRRARFLSGIGAVVAGLGLAVALITPAAAAPARALVLTNVHILNLSSSWWLTTNGQGNPVTATNNDGDKYSQINCQQVSGVGESCELTNQFGLCLDASTSTGELHAYPCTSGDEAELWHATGSDPYHFINAYWTLVPPVGASYMHEVSNSLNSDVYGNCASGCGNLAVWETA